MADIISVHIATNSTTLMPIVPGMFPMSFAQVTVITHATNAMADSPAMAPVRRVPRY